MTGADQLNVSFVCQWYPPEPVGVPESIVIELRRLDGVAVNVLTGVPNFPSGLVHAGYRASRGLREVVNGVDVQRTPLYASHDANAVRRFLNYGSWALSSTLLGQKRLRRADVALVYSSPATAALAAMAGRLLWRTPYVLLVQDLWPDSVFASGFLRGRLGRLAETILSSFVAATYRGSSHVVVISPSMADLLVERGVNRSKITLVYNWLPETAALTTGSTSEQAVSEGLRETFGIPAGDRLFLYAGNHGRAQGLEILIDAFGDPRTEGGHLVMLGDGVTKLELVARAQGTARVHFHDRVDRAAAMRFVESADVHVVCLADEPLFAVTMPSKVQSGLASGQPMLVVADGDPARIIQDHAAGRVASPGDADSVVDAVVALVELDEEQLSAMGENARRAYVAEMAAGVGAPRLKNVLVDAAAGRRRNDVGAAQRSRERK